jgi:hypothetical protein
MEIAVWLLCLSALGVAELAAKYLFGPAPMAYHAEILAYDGVEVTDGHGRVFRAIYRVLGCLSLALAVTLAVLALIPVAQGMLWAKLTILGIGGISVIGAFGVPYRVEKTTGLRTPWHPAAVLFLIMLVGVVLSLV